MRFARSALGQGSALPAEHALGADGQVVSIITAHEGRLWAENSAPTGAHQLNSSEQPPAISASSPSKNPCIGSDPNSAALEVIADDGISYLLPYAQFLYAERMANPALDKEPEAPPEKMSIHFACAEVTVRGSGLKWLERRLQQYELSFVMPAGSRLGAVYDTLITAVTVTLTKESV